jgi:perosamine synthetase
MKSFEDSVIGRIQEVIGTGEHVLHRPILGINEKESLAKCIDSTYVSSVGPFVNEFENGLCTFLKSTFAIAVSNGTSALHVALLISGVLPGDEVLLPSLTFVATANAVTYCGAVPHFVDSCVDSLGLDPVAIRIWLEKTADVSNGKCINKVTGRRIRAMIPVHIFGHPSKIKELQQVAEDYCLRLVEDAAESLGSTLNDKHCGTFGSVGILSFNGNKILTTGGGGAILTDDQELAVRAKHLTTTSKVPHQWEFNHDEVGFNYRMPNINASLGCAQLSQLPSFIVSKRKLASAYLESFSGLEGGRIFEETQGCKSNYWLQTLILDESHKQHRNKILEQALAKGLMCRPAWRPLHTLLPYENCPRSPLPVAINLHERIVNIPSSAGLV